MKKFVIAIVIVLLGITGWAGATYLIGGQVEQHYRDHIARFEQWGPLSLTTESYQRGFFASEGRTLVELSVPVPADQEGEVEKQALRLTLAHQLSHGPLPVGAGSFSLAPKLARIETRLVAASLGEDDLLAKLPWLAEISDRASIGLTGRGRDRLVVPAVEKTIEEDQLTITWGGLRSDTEFSSDLTDLAGKIAVAPLQLKDEDGRLQWDGAQVDFDLHEAFPMVYLGSYQTSSGPLALAFNQPGKGPQTVRIEGLAIDSLASQKDATVEYLQTLKVAKIDVNEDGYGPGELELAVRGLDGEVLSRYQQDALGIYGQESFDPESMGLYMMQVYMQLWSGLIKGTPEIELRKLQIATPQGDFSANLRLKLHGGEELQPGDMAAVLQKLEGQAQLIADEALVRAALTGTVAQQIKSALEEQDAPQLTDAEIAALAAAQVEQQLAGLIGQQFIERSDGKLRCQAVLDGGELKVNGQRVM